ncbi:MAG: hydroxymethylbilane synthase [Alphaproteobacteria bacterium]|nr:hydroxymethylbilane synthase [Alphaproteobacteria bacterium]
MNGDAMDGALVIGTRGSPLALVQANMVRDLLHGAHPGLEVTLSVIKTSGDRFLDRPLAEIGGKGLFTKEIEEAMAAGLIHIAVHSMKDVPTVLPQGLHIPCLPPREDPRDVLLTADSGVTGIAGLPQGARVGTASLRRKAQLLALRPDLMVVPIRGNVGTRMDKLAAGDFDAILLALAGLRRLGLADHAVDILGEDEMLPAVAQGALGIECREGDAAVEGLLAPIHDPATGIAVAAERALLAALEGSCRTPIAALARLDGLGRLTLAARVVAPDGSARFDAARAGPERDAASLGRDAALDLRAQAGDAFFAALAEA